MGSCEDILRSLRKKEGSSVVAGVPQVYQTHNHIYSLAV